MNSVTEEGGNGEVRLAEKEVVFRGVGGRDEEVEEVELEVAVTRGVGGSKKRLGGLGWGLLVLALGLLSGSAFVWGRRRRGRSRGGGRGSSSGVPSCSASTVRISIR